MSNILNNRKITEAYNKIVSGVCEDSDGKIYTIHVLFKNGEEKVATFKNMTDTAMYFISLVDETPMESIEDYWVDETRTINGHTDTYRWDNRAFDMFISDTRIKEKVNSIVLKVPRDLRTEERDGKIIIHARDGENVYGMDIAQELGQLNGFKYIDWVWENNVDTGYRYLAIPKKFVGKIERV